MLAGPQLGLRYSSKTTRKSGTMFALTLLFICIFAAALGQIVLKQGSFGIDKINDIDDLLKLETFINIFTNKYIILGLVLYGSAFILWMAAMSTLDISFMYPMISLAYIITAAMAFIFFGENVSGMRWLGIILVVAGCLLIGRS
ncbi:MAG: SMR family transporter [Methanotrichaceae archaeon]|nr:SMR family transporter [Methanotrichaceae archaeon]